MATEYFCEALVLNDEATRTGHITDLIETLTQPGYLWRVLRQAGREVDRIDSHRVKDDRSEDAKATLSAAQAHLDQACSLLSRLSYQAPTRHQGVPQR